MMEQVGRRTAKVQICTDPLLGGISEALKWDRINEIIEMYPTVDLFLLCVDRDGMEGRRISLDNIEQLAVQTLRDHRLILAENAWQEIEVWALAGHKLPRGWK